MDCDFELGTGTRRDKNKDNGILLAKMDVLNLSKRGDADG